MDLHPVLVHFPIAFLTIYSLLELARFRFLLRLPSFWPLKMFLLVFGTLGSYLAYISGKWGTGVHSASILKAVDAHATFALSTLVIYSLLMLAYGSMFFLIQSGVSFRIIRFINAPLILITLAALGFSLLCITGGLGGGIVYGPDVDPAVHFFYSFF